MIKHLFRLVFLICLYGCSGNSDNHVNRPDEKQFNPNIENDPIQGLQYHYLQYGLYIENGPRHGILYTNPSGKKYDYRNYTITIWNDSTVAIQLEIGFSEMGMNLKDSTRSKFFLLPRHLTPNEQHSDKRRMSKELERFIDFEIDNPVHLSKVLNPREKCVLTFGVLTDPKYPTPTTSYETKLLASYENSSAISLKFRINDTLIIPCGQFSYMQK
jgi:hypothetical protein